MDLGAGVKSFTTKSTTSYFTHLNHAKPDSLNCNRATSYAQFRPHRNPSRRASLRVKSSSTESISKVNVMPADDYALDLELSSLAALCPLDGRYWSKVKDLAPFMSEFGLIKYRVLVEIKWLLKLSQISGVAEVPRFSREAESYLQNIIDQFNLDDALEVKKIEKVTNHDVKAVEYFLKQRCQSNPEINKMLEFFHFACTSEDINNLAHALMLKEAVNKVMLPSMDKLIRAICDTATASASIPMLSRTHGQRDLTDSTVIRNMGVGLGHSLLAYKSALQGIAKLQVNEASLNADLNQSWEVVAEPIQTVMRRYGVPGPYEKLKELKRGRSVTRESIREFIEGLDIPIQAMKGLLDLTPHTYIGEAAGLAKNANLLRSSVNGARLS